MWKDVLQSPSAIPTRPNDAREWFVDSSNQVRIPILGPPK